MPVCSCACEYTAQNECIKLYGIFKRAIMIFDKHANLKYNSEIDIFGQRDIM